MKFFNTYLFFFCFIISSVKSQNKSGPVAKFSFNDKKDYDEISGKKIKLIGTGFTEDRFGNKNNAISVFGEEHSYINLGNYSALKQKTATISIWVKIQRRIWAGTGYHSNPILLTKKHDSDDFFESYSINYDLESRKIVTVSSSDSLNQIACVALKEIELFEWYHVVMTYNYNFQSCYINGQLQRKAVKNFETVFSATDSVLIGASANKKNKRFLDAEIDDIAFYDRVLSNQEILDLYNAPNPNKLGIFFNWLLVSAIILLIIFTFYLFIKYRIKIAIKKERKRLELNNKLLETELRVNRALMNPHFVFNSLNSLQTFILKNENDRANKYLIKFSKLLRKILENNMSESISLETEIDLIQRYLEIEDLRFEEDVIHSIYIDKPVNPSSIKIPIMMIQPFIENAIWHGLLKKNGAKILNISFFLHELQYLKCIIEDNGTGRKKKETFDIEKKSLGIGFVVQRLQLFSKILNLHCSLLIEDKPNMEGTIVTIILPILK